MLFLHQNGEEVIVISLATYDRDRVRQDGRTIFSRSSLAVCATLWRKRSVVSPKAFSSPAARK